MFNRDRWKEILEVLTGNWFRTVLTAFGVFWGNINTYYSACCGKGLGEWDKGRFWRYCYQHHVYVVQKHDKGV